MVVQTYQEKGRTIGYTREPSEFVISYQRFESMYAQLIRGKDNEMWRLDPRLKNFPTFEVAQASILREWMKSGYKAEIELAKWSFETANSGEKWRTWAAANHTYSAHSIPIDLYTKLPETYLIPPPASWSSVSSWIRAVSKIPAQGVEFRFQLARVQVARPWMDLGALLSGSLNSSDTVPGGGVAISDGTSPTLDALPSGILPAFIEELLIVRDITVAGNAAAVNSTHPLRVFAYPDAVNIIGYVVRVLPGIPSTTSKRGVAQARNN